MKPERRAGELVGARLACGEVEKQEQGQEAGPAARPGHESC